MEGHKQRCDHMRQTKIKTDFKTFLKVIPLSILSIGIENQIILHLGRKTF